MSEVYIKNLINDSNIVDNNTDFIIITGNNIIDLFILLNCSKDNVCIYWYNINRLSNVLNTRNININNFKFLFQTETLHDNKPNTIIMANNNITKKPKNYSFIQNYDNGSLWCPHSIDNYVSVGLLYSSNKNIPQYDLFGLLNKNIISKYSNDIQKIKLFDYLYNRETMFNHNLCEQYTDNLDTFEGEFTFLKSVEKPWYNEDKLHIPQSIQKHTNNNKNDELKYNDNIVYTNNMGNNNALNILSIISLILIFCLIIIMIFNLRRKI